MGNVFSSVATGRRDNVTGESEVNMASSSDDSEEFHDTIDIIDHEDKERVRAKEAEMEEFRRELQIKREQRREILDRHKTEKKELEVSLDNERKAKLEAFKRNRMLRDLLIRNNIEIPEELQCPKENSDITETIEAMKEEFEKLRENNNRLRRDLAETNKSLQGAYSDIADLQQQNTESMKHINALKEVISVSKTMLNLREQQLNELKNKLGEIEQSLADREASMLSTDLREEYERQLQNIRTLRTLYEERARLAEVTRQGLLLEVEEQKALKQAEIDKVTELIQKVDGLEAKVEELQETISNKNNQIYTCQDETRGLKAEMSAVNKLFSQVLLGYKSPQDLDKLVHRLEENHGLLTHMAEKENDLEASTALPKLLLEIVSQVDDLECEEDKIKPEGSANSQNAESTDIQNSTNTTAEEIVQNLPKVWRVLMELLSHQAAPDENAQEKVTTCYKTVETKSGPVQVPSVSQTYIRLKDLIIEKLALIKEVNRMKQLNVHLENRLEEQERRLCLVTTELGKTWHVVGRLRRHHHQLHTHEKILKYELQQKRKLLNELKEELEYCREKWEQARQKNTQSEKDWKKLRAEFSSRKNKSSASINNSAESGYSDERPSDESSESTDESEYVTEPLISRSKKKIKKSFETVLDSSTDFNPAAEREDPASDMLDVADLPLDTQEGDEHNVSEACNTESLQKEKGETICEETEDEAGDIAHDSCSEDSIVDSNQHSDLNKASESKLPQLNVPIIHPAAILKSIKEQTERLARKDKKLENLEKSGALLLQKVQTTAKISDQINITLDHLLNRPSTSTPQNDDSAASATMDAQSIEKETPIKNETPEQNGGNVEQNTNSCSNISNKTNALSHPKDDQELSVDFNQILENVKQQSERVAKKERRLERLERKCTEVVNKLENVVVSEEKILAEPCKNVECAQNVTSIGEVTKTEITDSEAQNVTSIEQVTKTEITDSEAQNVTGIEEVTKTKVNDSKEASTDETDSTTEPATSVDFQAILENVRLQNERLAKKDERLNELENGCSEVVNNISNTLRNGLEIAEKLDTLHSSSENKANKDKVELISKEDSEPSTSNEMDHEARFAARDIRLKRLEEQTKSLVNKVNKTTTKGVKINYKLEELHNIYGSENSRAGTPSDVEDKSIEEKSNEDDSNENPEE